MVLKDILGYGDRYEGGQCSTLTADHLSFYAGDVLAVYRDGSASIVGCDWTIFNEIVG